MLSLFCNKCGTATEHYKKHQCKPCRARYNKEYRALRREALNEKNKQWRGENAESIKAKSAESRMRNKAVISERGKAYYEANKEKLKAGARNWRTLNRGAHNVTKSRNRLLRVYGITVEQYEEQFRTQGERCVCGREPSEGRRLAVDHCHQSGKVRGLLCQQCNTALGKMDDSPQKMRFFADYLERGGVWAA
jgi:hypothetical protein